MTPALSVTAANDPVSAFAPDAPGRVLLGVVGAVPWHAATNITARYRKVSLMYLIAILPQSRIEGDSAVALCRKLAVVVFDRGATEAL